MIFSIVPILALFATDSEAYFGTGCPGPFVARTYQNCQAMFGAVKGYQCGQLPAPSDAYGACVTAASQ